MSNPIEVSLRVWVPNERSGDLELAGTFTAHLPVLPPVGSLINVASTVDVKWQELGEVRDFAAHLRDQNLLVPAALKVATVAFQLDNDGACVDVRVNTAAATDPTVVPEPPRG